MNHQLVVGVTLNPLIRLSAFCHLSHHQNIISQNFSSKHVLVTIINVSLISSTSQICQGIWQLCSHLTLADAGALCELLQTHQDVAGPLMQKAYLSLPPERSGHALQAQHRVEELLGCDALTESQQQALLTLETLTSPSTNTT